MQTAPTSAQSYASISNPQRKTQHDEIFDIVLAACRNGAPDMTDREIADTYERIYSRRIERGTVSARVKAMLDGGRLVSLEGAQRQCVHTKKLVRTVTVPAHQERMFY